MSQCKKPSIPPENVLHLAELQAGAAASEAGVRHAQGTTTNGQSLLNFKTGAFLAGAPVQPVVLKYAPGKVAPAWESIDALWHVFLMLANLHQVTCYEVRPPSQT